MTARRASWLLCSVVIGVALVIGATRDGGPETNADRAHALAEQLKCPTCRSESVADSAAATSEKIRIEIARRVDAGQSDEQILGYFESRYGEDVLLTPAGSGFAGMVWVLPVTALVLAVAGLAFAFRRWAETPSDGAAPRSASSPAPPSPPSRGGASVSTASIAAAVVLFAVVAGVVMARASGSRGFGDTTTGDIRLTAREQLVDAQELLGAGDFAGAARVYDEVLEAEPSNAEALAWRGWAVVVPKMRSDDAAQAKAAYLEGMRWVDKAITADPEYPDARAFKVVLLSRLGRDDELADAVDAFIATDPPAQMRELVANIEIPAAPVDRCVGLIERTDVRGALECLSGVLAADPNDTDAMAFQGWLLTLTAMEAERLGSDVDTDELYLESLDWFDRALDLEPEQSYALAFRIVTLDRLGRFDERDAALADFLAIDPTDEMLAQLATYVPELVGTTTTGRS